MVEIPHGVDFSNSVVQAPVGTSKMLEEAAQWAKRNAKALKLARYAFSELWLLYKRSSVGAVMLL